MSSLDTIYVYATDDYVAYYNKIGGGPNDTGCTIEVTRITVSIEGRTIDVLSAMSATEVGHVKDRIYRADIDPWDDTVRSE